MAASASGRKPQLTRDQRIEALPGFGPLQSAYETARLGWKVLSIAVRPPYSWVKDAIVESNSNFVRCLVPLAVSQSIWIIGFGVLNFGSVAAILGVTDRDPGGVYIGYVREVATWITMMILAGVAGSGLAADLGARKIREELDALAVLGVDTTRKLIVPRVMAMIFCSVILGLIGLFIAIMCNYTLFPMAVDFPHAVYRQAWFLNISALDLGAAIVKHAFIGLVLGLVACEKGLNTKGGAEGVGQTVNQTVIVSFVAIWAINSLYNVAVLTLFPGLSIQKG